MIFKNKHGVINCSRLLFWFYIYVSFEYDKVSIDAISLVEKIHDKSKWYQFLMNLRKESEPFHVMLMSKQ